MRVQMSKLNKRPVISAGLSVDVGPDTSQWQSGSVHSTHASTAASATSYAHKTNMALACEGVANHTPPAGARASAHTVAAHHASVRAITFCPRRVQLTTAQPATTAAAGRASAERSPCTEPTSLHRRAGDRSQSSAAQTTGARCDSGRHSCRTGQHSTTTVRYPAAHRRQHRLAPAAARHHTICAAADVA